MKRFSKIASNPALLFAAAWMLAGIFAYLSVQAAPSHKKLMIVAWSLPTRNPLIVFAALAPLAYASLADSAWRKTQGKIWLILFILMNGLIFIQQAALIVPGIERAIYFVWEHALYRLNAASPYLEMAGALSMPMNSDFNAFEPKYAFMILAAIGYPILLYTASLAWACLVFSRRMLSIGCGRLLSFAYCIAALLAQSLALYVVMNLAFYLAGARLSFPSPLPRSVAPMFVFWLVLGVFSLLNVFSDRILPGGLRREAIQPEAATA